MRWLDSITNAMNVNLGKLWEVVRDRDSLARCSLRGCKELDVTGQLNNNNEWLLSIRVYHTRRIDSGHPEEPIQLLRPGICDFGGHPVCPTMC